MRTTSIYALLDPRTDEIRYVGKADHPHERLLEHINRTKNGTDVTNTHKVNWIKLLLKNNLRPTLKIIEECDNSVWKQREMYWIAYGRESGWPLLNASNGGDGHGIVYTEERRAKHRISQRRRYSQSVYLISRLKKAKKKLENRFHHILMKRFKLHMKFAKLHCRRIKTLSQKQRDTIEKMRLNKIGKPRPLEVKEKIRAGNMGRVPWNKGIILPESVKSNMRKPHKKRIK